MAKQAEPDRPLACGRANPLFRGHAAPFSRESGYLGDRRTAQLLHIVHGKRQESTFHS